MFGECTLDEAVPAGRCAAQTLSIISECMPPAIYRRGLKRAAQLGRNPVVVRD